MKLFGRDPAVLLAVASTVIQVISLFVVELSPEQQGLLNAVLLAAVGLATAFAVRGDSQLPAIVGFGQAALAVAISFGLDWTPEQQVAALGLLSTVAAVLFVRPNVVAPVAPTDGTRASSRLV